ncbi:MAG: hypothetical protein QM661_15980 [Solimonas sp.]
MLGAQAARDAYRVVPLKQPLKDSLAAKRQRMEAALSAYASASDSGVADVVTEAAYETAELYHDLARALKQSERPKNLDAEARDQYDLLLDEQIDPFIDKAIALHEANIRRVTTGLYDPWIARSYAALAALAPGRYAKADASEPAVAPAAPGTSLPARAAQAFQQAADAQRTQDWRAAEVRLQQLQRDYPELPGAPVNLAIVYRLGGQGAAARPLVEKAAKRWPGYAPAQHQLGLQLRDAGRFTDADAAYARAIALDPGYAAAIYDRGVLNDLYLQRLDVALAAYEQYQRLQAAPDAQVARWIVDLRRRSGAPSAAATGASP